MKKVRKGLQNIKFSIKSRKKYHFIDWPDWLLAIVGSLSFLIAGYWGLLLADVVPKFIIEVNKYGYTNIMGGLAGGVLALLGLQVWFYGSIAARCNSILFDKWFK